MLRNCNCSNELEEISKNDKVKDDLEIDLALLQHYGASTRCIDFSKNIKVALYFATCDWDSPDCVDGSIYITNFFYFTNHNGLQIILLIMWQNSMIKASLIGIFHTIL